MEFLASLAIKALIGTSICGTVTVGAVYGYDKTLLGFSKDDTQKSPTNLEQVGGDTKKEGTSNDASSANLDTQGADKDTKAGSVENIQDESSKKKEETGTGYGDTTNTGGDSSLSTKSPIIVDPTYIADGQTTAKTIDTTGIGQKEVSGSGQGVGSEQSGIQTDAGTPTVNVLDGQSDTTGNTDGVKLQSTKLEQNVQTIDSQGTLSVGQGLGAAGSQPSPQNDQLDTTTPIGTAEQQNTSA